MLGMTGGGVAVKWRAGGGTEHALFIKRHGSGHCEEASRGGPVNDLNNTRKSCREYRREHRIEASCGEMP
eukprot:scaffold14713_cov131-Isochrysis_galbana.AAC.2